MVERSNNDKKKKSWHGRTLRDESINFPFITSGGIRDVVRVTCRHMPSQPKRKRIKKNAVSRKRAEWTERYSPHTVHETPRRNVFGMIFGGGDGAHRLVGWAVGGQLEVLRDLPGLRIRQPSHHVHLFLKKKAERENAAIIQRARRAAAAAAAAEGGEQPWHCGSHHTRFSCGRRLRGRGVEFLSSVLGFSLPR